MNIKIFVVFHKALDEIVFSNFQRHEIQKWFVKYAVNEKHLKAVIRRDENSNVLAKEESCDDLVFEYKLPKYDPNIQARGFMETSCYIHVLNNGLYESADLIGVCQYDMIWTEPAVKLLRNLAADTDGHYRGSFGLNVGPLCDANGYLHQLTFADRINWPFLLESYNRHFHTRHGPQIFFGKPLSLFQTYLLPRSEFLDLASWLNVLCDELYPTHCAPPYETHWGSLSGKTERAESIFVAARLHEKKISFQHLPLNHDEEIVKRLGITKEHYAKP